MNKAMHAESSHVVVVLEQALEALTLTATIPQDLQSAARTLADMCVIGPEAAQAIQDHLETETALAVALQRKVEASQRPEVVVDEDDDIETLQTDLTKRLHHMLRCVVRDKPARDAFRSLTATSVSPEFAALALAWTDLIMIVETHLSTSPEQDDRAARKLRESRLRLREIEDDRKQVAFELLTERESRANLNLKHTAIIASLRDQLQDTQRAADEALVTCQRSREQDLHTIQSTFTSQNMSTSERFLAMDRTSERITDEHKQMERDDRKRQQRTAAELQELMSKYDQELLQLDEDIAREQSELRALDSATRSLVLHFERMDYDRSLQLDEQRAQELMEQRRRRQQLNVFRLLAKLQALVRGYLQRKQLALALKKKKPHTKRKKKKGTAVRKTSNTATKKKPTSKKIVKP